MKFLKQSQLNRHNLRDRDVAVVVDGTIVQSARVVMENTNSLRVPKGTTGERPDETQVEDGMVRYNINKNELEVRQNSAWRRVAFKEPHVMVLQDLGNGNASETVFGPLTSGSTNHDGSPYVPDLANPQNILVFVENVFQLAGINYDLIDNPPSKPPGRFIEFDSAVPFGKPVHVLHGIDR